MVGRRRDRVLGRARTRPCSRCALAGCILLYDGGVKPTRLGPVVMGGCRGLNMALGLVDRPGADAPLAAVAIAGPVFLALYVAGLTHLARDEVDGNTAAPRAHRAGVPRRSWRSAW